MKRLLLTACLLSSLAPSLAFAADLVPVAVLPPVADKKVPDGLTRAIQEHFPDAEYVRTQNAETNAPMVAINERLGFEIHTVEGEFQKHLT